MVKTGGAALNGRPHNMSSLGRHIFLVLGNNLFHSSVEVAAERQFLSAGIWQAAAEHVQDRTQQFGVDITRSRVALKYIRTAKLKICTS